jgi:hypothetical protein
MFSYAVEFSSCIVFFIKITISFFWIVKRLEWLLIWKVVAEFFHGLVSKSYLLMNFDL